MALAAGLFVRLIRLVGKSYEPVSHVSGMSRGRSAYSATLKDQRWTDIWEDDGFAPELVIQKGHSSVIISVLEISMSS